VVTQHEILHVPPVSCGHQSLQGEDCSGARSSSYCRLGSALKHSLKCLVDTHDNTTFLNESVIYEIRWGKSQMSYFYYTQKNEAWSCSGTCSNTPTKSCDGAGSETVISALYQCHYHWMGDYTQVYTKISSAEFPTCFIKKKKREREREKMEKMYISFLVASTRYRTFRVIGAGYFAGEKISIGNHAFNLNVYFTWLPQ